MGGGGFNTKQEIQNQYLQTQQRYANLSNILGQGYTDAKKKSDSLYDATNSGYQGIAANGGYSDASLAGINGDISGLRALGVNGGLDDNAMSRMRGGGLYDEAIKNGLYTDSMKNDLRARATSGVPSMFDAFKNNAATQNAAQGGYSPGYTYQNAKMARDTVREASGAAREAEIGINDSVIKNRFAGAAGMSNAENALQTLRTGNMFKGLEGAGNMSMSLNDSIAHNKLGALGGMSNLYSSTPGETNMYLSKLLQTYGMSDDQIAKLLSMRKDMGFNPMELLGLVKYAGKLIPKSKKKPADPNAPPQGDGSSTDPSGGTYDPRYTGGYSGGYLYDPRSADGPDWSHYWSD